MTPMATRMSGIVSRCFAAGLLLAVALHPLGCTETRVVNDPWGDLPIDRSPSAPDGGGSNPNRANQPDALLMQNVWTALVATYDGDDRDRRAANLMRQLQRRPGVPALWTHQRGDSLIVYAGRYTDPLGDRAQQQLAKLRAVELDGEQPFSGTKFVNFAQHAGPEEDTIGGQPTGQHDLKQFAGMYSLQIGFYDSEAGEDFRQAAEKAVTELRAEGEEAYYYHGPNRSLITIGLFTDEDLSSQSGITVYSPRIRELQERYPYNLANGRTLIEKRGDVTREQPSFVVQVH